MIDAKLFHKDSQIRIVYHALGERGYKRILLIGTTFFLVFGFASKIVFIFPIYWFLFYIVCLLIVIYDFKSKDFDILILGYSDSQIHFQKYVTNIYGRYSVPYAFEALNSIHFFESDWTLVFRGAKDQAFKISRSIPLALMEEMLEIAESKINRPCTVVKRDSPENLERLKSQ